MTALIVSGLAVVAWLLQNCVHELSHVVAVKIYHNKRILGFYPYPHWCDGRFYFARYSCEPFNLLDHKQVHSMPLWSSVVQFAILAVVTKFNTEHLFFLLPFLVAPLADAAWWFISGIRKPGDLDYDFNRWFLSKRAELGKRGNRG